jgi:hypothetical protein
MVVPTLYFIIISVMALMGHHHHHERHGPYGSLRLSKTWTEFMKGVVDPLFNSV